MQAHGAFLTEERRRVQGAQGEAVALCRSPTMAAVASLARSSERRLLCSAGAVRQPDQPLLVAADVARRARRDHVVLRPRGQQGVGRVQAHRHLGPAARRARPRHPRPPPPGLVWAPWAHATGLSRPRPLLLLSGRSRSISTRGRACTVPPPLCTTSPHRTPSRFAGQAARALVQRGEEAAGGRRGAQEAARGAEGAPVQLRVDAGDPGRLLQGDQARGRPVVPPTQADAGAVLDAGVVLRAAQLGAEHVVQAHVAPQEAARNARRRPRHGGRQGGQPRARRAAAGAPSLVELPPTSHRPPTDLPGAGARCTSSRPRAW